MRKTKGSGPDKMRLREGRRLQHGGYTFMRTGKIPGDKREVERYLTAIRCGYIADIGPNESDLTTGQLVLLDTLITLKGVNRCVEIECARVGNIGGLDERYNARNNQVIKICMALGIDARLEDRALTPLELAEKIDREEKEK